MFILININYETCELSVSIMVKRSGQPGCNGNDISRHQVEYYVAGACSITPCFSKSGTTLRSPVLSNAGILVSVCVWQKSLKIQNFLCWIYVEWIKFGLRISGTLITSLPLSICVNNFAKIYLKKRFFHIWQLCACYQKFVLNYFRSMRIVRIYIWHGNQPRQVHLPLSLCKIFL